VHQVAHLPREILKGLRFCAIFVLSFIEIKKNPGEISTDKSPISSFNFLGYNTKFYDFETFIKFM